MRPGNRRAFTAIEMLLVLALMAIVAAGASLSLAEVQINSDMAGVIDRIQYFDALTRRQAEQSGRTLMLVFDAAAVRRAAFTPTPDDSTAVSMPQMRLAGPSHRRADWSSTPTLTLTLSTRGGNESVDFSSYAIALMRLPDGFIVERVKINAIDQSGVPISADGISPTYALLLSRHGQRRWMIVSSLGQSRQAADNGTIDYEMDQLRQR